MAYLSKPNNMKRFKIIALLAITIMVASCGISGIRGDGNVTTTKRNLGSDFTEIDASNGIEVEITQSSNASVEVVADENLQEHIQTSVSDGVLKITSDKNIAKSSSQKVIVRMPKLDNVQASSAASVNGKSVFRSSRFQCGASSAGEITIEIETEEFVGKASSGGEINVSGKAIALNVTTSSGGNIDAQKTLSNTIVASASSGGSIEVTPLVDLNASASSGGDISYFGEPKHFQKSESSGGSISKK